MLRVHSPHQSECEMKNVAVDEMAFGSQEHAKYLNKEGGRGGRERREGGGRGKETGGKGGREGERERRREESRRGRKGGREERKERGRSYSNNNCS